MVSSVIERTQKLAEEMKKKGGFYKALAKKLGASRRSRAAVNLSKLEKMCKDGDAVVVPGKILGTGELTKNVTVYALNFSESAEKKLGKKAMPIEDVLKVKKKPIIMC